MSCLKQKLEDARLACYYRLEGSVSSDISFWRKKIIQESPSNPTTAALIRVTLKNNPNLSKAEAEKIVIEDLLEEYWRRLILAKDNFNKEIILYGRLSYVLNVKYKNHE